MSLKHCILLKFLIVLKKLSSFQKFLNLELHQKFTEILNNLNIFFINSNLFDIFKLLYNGISASFIFMQKRTVCLRKNWTFLFLGAWRDFIFKWMEIRFIIRMWLLAIANILIIATLICVEDKFWRVLENVLNFICERGTSLVLMVMEIKTIVFFWNIFIDFWQGVNGA